MKPFAVIAASFAAISPIQGYAGPTTTIEFPLTVSPGAKTCLPKATGNVTDHTLGAVENLEVVVKGLPPNTDFDLFSIQVPNAPFGLSWYNGDIVTPMAPASVISSTVSVSRLSSFPPASHPRPRSSRNRPSRMHNKA